MTMPADGVGGFTSSFLDGAGEEAATGAGAGGGAESGTIAGRSIISVYSLGPEVGGGAEPEGNCSKAAVLSHAGFEDGGRETGPECSGSGVGGSTLSNI